MKKIYNIIAAAALLGSLTGCNDFLDRESSAYDSDGFYQSLAGMQEGLTAVYQLVPYDHNWDVPPTMVQDIYTPYGMEVDENNTIGAGVGLTPDATYVTYYWNNHWKIVSRANNVLDGSRQDLEEAPAEYRQYVAECKVLRAYAYYNLMTTFGDIPFFTRALTPDDYTCMRTPKEDIADYIIAELTAIGESEDLEWTASQRGRIDRAATYALLSRYCLFAGSLDFNGRGAEYFAKAASAASEVMAHRGLAADFTELFTNEGQTKADVRDEMLWELVYIPGDATYYHRTRLGHTSRTAGGSTVRFPSLLLVDTYECADGLRIDKSPLYNPREPMANRDPRLKHTILGHGDTLVYSPNGGSTINMVVLNAYDNKAVIYPDPRKPGRWGKADNIDVTGTAPTFCRNGGGFCWQKYNDDLTEGFSSSTCDISIIRTAEVYLTYAEAMIELGQYSDPSVVATINKVRTRAGQPAIDANGCVAGETLDGLSVQDKLRQRVRRERKCELAMEGVIFTDMRRWQIGDICNDQPTYGNPKSDIRYEGLEMTDIPVYNTSDRHNINDVANYAAFAEKLRVRDRQRFWADRFQWWPVPRADVDRNPNLANPEGY